MDLWTDTVDIVYFTGHGTPWAFYFRSAVPDDNLIECDHYTDPTNGDLPDLDHIKPLVQKSKRSISRSFTGSEPFRFNESGALCISYVCRGVSVRRGRRKFKTN